MATISKVRCKSHDACKAVINLRNTKPFSPSKLRKDARHGPGAKRIERDITVPRVPHIPPAHRVLCRAAGFHAFDLYHIDLKHYYCYIMLVIISRKISERA